MSNFSNIILMAPMTILIALFTMGLPIVLLILLQVLLSKRGPRLGLILPGLSLALSLLISLGIGAFTAYPSAGNTRIAELDEFGNEISVTYGDEALESPSVPPRAFATVAVFFLVCNIPTLVFIGIWAHYKNRRDFHNDLNKMNIQDLE